MLASRKVPRTGSLASNSEDRKQNPACLSCSFYCYCKLSLIYSPRTVSQSACIEQEMIEFIGEKFNKESEPVDLDTTSSIDTSEYAATPTLKKRVNGGKIKELVNEVRTVRSDVKSTRLSFKKVDMYLKSMVCTKLGVKDEGLVQLVLDWDLLSLVGLYNLAVLFHS